MPSGDRNDDFDLQRSLALKRLVAQAGGRRYLTYSFRSWIATGPKQVQLKEAVGEWVATFPERLKSAEGLVLYGPAGTGKDHLAFAAVASAVRQFGATALWRNGRDLMGEVRDRIGEERPERALIAELEGPDILAISDPLPPFGDLTQHQADVLYRVIENRLAQMRMTICTLNVSSDDEADRRIGAPTWDRLCCGAWKLACFGRSHRKPARELTP